MSRKNRNFQRPSPRPVSAQASTRPAAEGEAALDNIRVPSPATHVQEQVDVQRADRDRYSPRDGNLTNTDPDRGEATDLVSGDDVVMDERDDEQIAAIEEAERADAEAEDGTEVFTHFDDPEARVKRQAPVAIDLVAERQKEDDERFVAVVPRRTVMRTKIGANWYNFVKGHEQFVPAWVRDHLAEKGVI